MTSSPTYGPSPGGPCIHGHIYPATCPLCTPEEELVVPDKPKRLQRWYVKPNGTLIHCDDNVLVQSSLEERIVKSSDVETLEIELAKTKKAELLATKAMTYLAGKLSASGKMSVDWIQEALAVVKED